MTGKAETPSRGLALAFGGVVIAFVGATLVADWRTFSIDRETQALLGDALPSIEYLGDVNGAVREIQASVDDLYDVDAPHHAEVHASIDSSWKTIDLALVRYRELPAFKGEAELFADIPAALRDFDVAVRTTIAEAESGAVDKARVDSDVLIRPRANRITHLIREVVRLNATNAVAAATRIDATRHATVALSALLNVIAVLLTIGAARWVARLVRAHDELLAARLAFEEDRTAELEVFAQRVAHDLLSPLSSLSFCLAAFKKPSTEDPKLGHALERARQCVARAKQLVDNVFDFARAGGAASPESRVDLPEAIAEILSESHALATDANVQVSASIVPACAVRCSRGVLGSIVGNLVRNAIRYMGDSIERRVTVRVTELDEYVRIQVSDTGPGIPPSIEGTLFQPYVRGEGVTQSGLGLGLATVRRFCEGCGGTVEVRSLPGRGAIFQVVLPKATAGDVPSGIPDLMDRVVS